MSDSYFIGTVARVHNLWRFSSPDKEKQPAKIKDHPMAKMEDEENKNVDRQRPRASIGIMVSLDHAIYFHRPRDIRADEWLLSENESPWSGDGRGLVFQKIWNKEGKLVASCVQEVSREILDPNRPDLSNARLRRRLSGSVPVIEPGANPSAGSCETGAG